MSISLLSSLSCNSSSSSSAYMLTAFTCSALWRLFPMSQQPHISVHSSSALRQVHTVKPDELNHRLWWRQLLGHDMNPFVSFQVPVILMWFYFRVRHGIIVPNDGLVMGLQDCLMQCISCGWQPLWLSLFFLNIHHLNFSTWEKLVPSR